MTLPLWVLRDSDLPGFKNSHPDIGNWLDQNGFNAERHRVVVIPGPQGEVRGAVVGLGPLGDWQRLSWWHASGLTDRLPARDFHLEGDLPVRALEQILLGWMHGSYRLNRYKSSVAPISRPRIKIPSKINGDTLLRQSDAMHRARDLINAPANELGPTELATAAADLAREYAAEYRCLEGD
ncbi:MAG: hypothetical protein ACO32H_06345, partial [Steroidobacteraceae bacterium]